MSKYHTIMLVDDSEIDNLVNNHIITRNELCDHIVIVTSAQEALQYLNGCIQGQNTLVPELILLDINMPIMNGFGFLKEFEKFPNHFTEKIKIIMLSSSVDPNDMRRSNESRFVSGFISKPLTIEQFQ